MRAAQRWCRIRVQVRWRTRWVVVGMARHWTLAELEVRARDVLEVVAKASLSCPQHTRGALGRLAVLLEVACGGLAYLNLRCQHDRP